MNDLSFLTEFGSADPSIQPWESIAVVNNRDYKVCGYCSRTTDIPEDYNEEGPWTERIQAYRKECPVGYVGRIYVKCSHSDCQAVSWDLLTREQAINVRPYIPAWTGCLVSEPA